mmetsp:Transcript_30366/g.55063  ORF Transcript_30366/g.55063 Transcript_30366/m.55063 type:complete len:1295 (-) Transcript_30366:124-4008(-)
MCAWKQVRATVTLVGATSKLQSPPASPSPCKQPPRISNGARKAFGRSYTYADTEAASPSDGEIPRPSRTPRRTKTAPGLTKPAKSQTMPFTREGGFEGDDPEDLEQEEEGMDLREVKRRPGKQATLRKAFTTNATSAKSPSKKPSPGKDANGSKSAGHHMASVDSSSSAGVSENPNEVILEGREDDSDDDDEDLSGISFAIDRVIDSGRMSTKETLLLQTNFEDVSFLSGASYESLASAMRSARYVEAKEFEILWKRPANDVEAPSNKTQVLRCIFPLIFVLSGEVLAQTVGHSMEMEVEGVCFDRGKVVNTMELEVQCLRATEDCKLLVAEASDVQAAFEQFTKSQQLVLAELRRKRPPAVWSEELLDRLASILQELPFFEDIEPPVLRKLVPYLRYRRCRQGAALPRGQTAQTPSSSSQVKGKHEDEGLTVFLAGSAWVYNQVSQAQKDDSVLEQLATTARVRGLSADDESFAGESRRSRLNRKRTGVDIGAVIVKDDEAFGEEEPDQPAKVSVDERLFLKRTARDLQPWKVLGQQLVIEPNSYNGDPIVRCAGLCEVLILSRSDYLRNLSEQQIEKHRAVHALRNVPSSRPGEPHKRSEEQLTLLAKSIQKQSTFKDFPRSTILQVLGAATYLHAAAGHVLCRQGEIGDRFFAILDGRVSVHVSNDNFKRFKVKKSVEAFAPPTPTATSRQASVESQASDSSAASRMTAGEVKGEHSPDVPTTSVPQGSSHSGTDEESPRNPKKQHFRISFQADGEATSSQATESQDASSQVIAEVKQVEEASTSRDSRERQLEDTETRLAETEVAAPEPKVATRGKPNILEKFRKSVRRVKKAEVHEPLGRVVNRLGAGTAFGAITLLQGEARTASCKTVELSKLLVVTRQDYVALVAAMEEAAQSEAIEFMCRHLLHLDFKQGIGRRAADHLHPTMQMRLERAAKNLKSVELERGTVLVNHASTAVDNVYMLRKGAVAFCWPVPALPSHPPKQARFRKQQRCRGGAGATMSATKVVTSAGEVIGAYCALLEEAEPASVRVESATCEMFVIPQAELMRVLPLRSKNDLRDKFMKRYGKTLTPNPMTPKALLEAYAADCRKHEKPMSEEEALSNAVAKVFEAVTRYADGFGPGMDGAAIDSLRASSAHGGTAGKRGRLQFQRRGNVLPGQGLHSDQENNLEMKAQFREGLKKALGTLEEATQQAGNLKVAWAGASEKTPKHTQPIRPPPVTSAAHLRAQVLQVLNQDSSEAMAKFLHEVQLDPHKGDLNDWIKKLVNSSFMQRHPELQDLQLLVRRHERVK